MCEFVSWIEHEGNIYYLNDDCLRDKKGRELKKHLGKQYNEDIKGHGAIRYYYDIKDYVGINKEYTGTDLKEYPVEILNDIKRCKFKKIGFNINFLTQPAWEKYKAMKQPAREKYEAVEQQAWEKYYAVRQQAWEKYKAVIQPAWEKYEAVEQQVFWDIFKIKKNRIKSLTK
jgi:hypothetical protein